MATVKTNSRPRTTASRSRSNTTAKSKTPATPKDNDTRRWLLGFLFIFVSIYIGLSVFSYMIFWKTDQGIARLSISETRGTEELAAKVANWGGPFGVKIGELLVRNSFGIFGLLVPVVFLILSLRVLRFRPVMLDKSVRISLMAMILGSITFGYIGNLFSREAGVFGTGLGGAHGVFMAEWIESYISYGTGLLLLVLIVFLAIYINKNTIRLINRFGKGIAEKSKGLTATVAGAANDLITHSDNAHLQPEPEQPSPAAIPAPTVTATPAQTAEIPAVPKAPGFFGRLFTRANKQRATGYADPDMEVTSSPAPSENSLKPTDNTPVDYDFRYADESVEPIPSVPPRRRKFVQESPEDDFEFTVRTLGKEEDDQQIAVPPARQVEIADRMPESGRYREVVDADGFIVRELIPEGLPQPVPIEVDLGFSVARPTVNDLYSGPQATTTPPSGTDSDEIRFSEPEDIRLPEPQGTGTQTIPEETVSSQPYEPVPDPIVDTFSEYDMADDDESPYSRKNPTCAGVTWIDEESNTIRIDENFTVEVAPEDELVDDDRIDSGFYDHTLDLSYYQKPPVELLKDHYVEVNVTDEELRANQNKIRETLVNFGIEIRSIHATVGPTVTLYEIIPAPGVRISKIKNLENDIALSLAALGIRIIAPIPGKGTIGIEVPNKDKEIVSMYSAIKSKKFQESDFDLPIVLGRTIQNENYTIDLAKMPHLLVAGATGQGKSVGLNAIITSLLYKKHPSELKFVMVDPKKVELTLYGLLEKHFLAKMASEEEAIITDTQKVVYTLNSLCIEMDSRYDLLKNAAVRNIKEYNKKFAERRLNPNKGHRYLPYIVVIIDEYADLLVTAGREIETPLARIAQLARAVGIHLVIATQRPTADVITGLIKSNIPARIAFRVTSMMNSRTILDSPGAEQLIGRGDMLVSTGGEPIRVQCAFVDTPEIEDIMQFISNQRGYTSAYELPEYSPEGEAATPDADLSRRDALFEEAARLVVSQQQGSTSLIQRKFAIGYNRAGRIMDQLEVAGIVGRAEGSKPREVKITDIMSLEFILENMNTFH